MCTFPRADWSYDKAKGKGADWAAGYFNECMNGFEYQVAGHMIWEGMLTEGLAVTRMIHDRYHAARRNPWNEVECGDHYARSMASYGVFLAACGYEYHGPQRPSGFRPATDARELPRGVHDRRRLGHVRAETRRRQADGHDRVEIGPAGLNSLEFAGAGKRASDPSDRNRRRAIVDGHGGSESRPRADHIRRARDARRRAVAAGQHLVTTPVKVRSSWKSAVSGLVGVHALACQAGHARRGRHAKA